MSVSKSKYAEAIRSAVLWAAGLMAFLFSSCSLIYDDMENCEFGLQLRFKYDYNMSFGDAFTSQVSRVSVYVFKEDGEFVGFYEEKGEALRQEGYRMKMELPTGTYDILCWGGMYDDSFYHPGISDGSTPSIDCLEAMLKRDPDCSVKCSDGKPIRSIFWGEIKGIEIDEQRRQEATLSLMKLTNQLKVTLVNLSGEPISEKDMDFYMNGSNGRICADDASLLNDDMLKFHPYFIETAPSLALNASGTRAMTKGVTAELCCPRIVKEDKDLCLHAIDRHTGKDVLNFPVAQYLAGYRPSAYETSDGVIHFLDAQEYLDRQDLYNLTFILKEGNWISVEIQIMAWSIRVQNINL